MLVDEVLALYLFQVSKLVNNHFYLVVLKFVIEYRECFEIYGWSKIDGDLISDNSRVIPSFCEINTAEFLPSVCNEFI